MRLVILALCGLLLLALAAALWQHLRYLQTRREIVRDRQPLLYGSDALHVLTLLRVAPGDDVIDAVRKLKHDTEGLSGLRWIYAGKVAVNGLASSQLGPVDWSAVVLLQYDSRGAYDATSEALRRALARFPEHHSHGLRRRAGFNLLLPQLLLLRRLHQILTRQPSHFPFEPMPEAEREMPDDGRVEALLAERGLGARAVVVVNLLKRGTPEQRAADRAYGMRMLGMMAEGGHGPMHMGRAVRLEGDAEFDAVALVYYPGVDHFAAMSGSRFFQGIVGGKQLGDTQASVTVPILHLLQERAGVRDPARV